MVGEGGGQFLGQIREIGSLLRRIVMRMVVGQILVGQTRIRKGIVSLRLGSFVVIKKIRLLGLRIGLL